MEKEKPNATAEISSALRRLDLKSQVETLPSSSSSFPYRSAFEKNKPRGLVSLCLGAIGQYFEDLIVDLTEISAILPTNIKMAMVAIARRRKVLNDDVLIALADSAWDLMDISGSDVTDAGLAEVAKICTHLQAVDISHCNQITVLGVSDLIRQCHSLEILRCGGCTRSECTARRCLSILKPKLNSVEEESWEELDDMDIVDGAQSLRWLVWPKIDEDSKETLAAECPRIIVNPQPLPLSLRGILVPVGALPGRALDDPILEDIDPKTWAVSYVARVNLIPAVSDGRPELSVAEKFRLAFVERDMRLAPKRAKNIRQHRRRAERDWVMGSTDAKSIGPCFAGEEVAAQLKLTYPASSTCSLIMTSTEAKILCPCLQVRMLLPN